MDKQKQIDDLYDIMAEKCCDKSEDGCVEMMNCDECRAIAVYSAGYRKIPEGAVVLTEDCHKALVQVYEDWSERCTGVVYEARKETAREILQMLDDRNIITWSELKKAIAKRYGVEVDE